MFFFSRILDDSFIHTCERHKKKIPTGFSRKLYNGVRRRTRIADLYRVKVAL